MLPNSRRYRRIILQTLFILLALIVFDLVFIQKPQPHQEGPVPIPKPEVHNVDELVPFVPEATPHGEFIEIIDSCGPSFEGTCVYGHMHIAGELTPVTKLRNGMVLNVSERIIENDTTWYKVTFDEWIRYPDRLASELLVPERNTRQFTATSSESLNDGDHGGTSTKRIVIDRSEQMLRAYDGDTLFMEATTSTGVDMTPTPRGTFTIFKKTPSRYMQGPLPGINTKEYDLPGVPWNLYFTHEGAVIHGAYWHDKFGQQWSSGCVNLPPLTAERLYTWAELGTTVIVQD
jgi:hypothetical protein